MPSRPTSFSSRTESLAQARAERRLKLSAIIAAIRQHQAGGPLGPRALRAGLGAALAFVAGSLLVDATRMAAPGVVPPGSAMLVSLACAATAAAWVLRRSPACWSWSEEAGRLLADYTPADPGTFKAMLDELRAQPPGSRAVSPEQQRLEPVLRWALEEREALREGPRSPSAWDRLLLRRD